MKQLILWLSLCCFAWAAIASPKLSQAELLQQKSHFEKLVKKEKSASAYIGLGKTLIELGDLKSANKQASKAMRKAKTNEETLSSLALLMRVYNAQGNAKTSTQFYIKARSIEGSDKHAEMQLVIAQAYSQLGDKEIAIGHLNKILTLNSGFVDEAESLLSELQPERVIAKSKTNESSTVQSKAKLPESTITDKTAPIITLQRGINVVESARHTVYGQASDDSGVAIVEVNGREASLDTEGNFSLDILLRPGANTITITAVDTEYNATTETITVNRESAGNQAPTQRRFAGPTIDTGQYHALIIGVQDYSHESIADLSEPVNKAHLTGDEIALVIGCGPIGLAVIAALKVRGIKTVLASDLSPNRRERAAMAGATEVINPSEGSAFEPLNQHLKHEPAPTVVFECVGAVGLLQQICAETPAHSRIVIAGLCTAEDSFMPIEALRKELSIQYVFYYEAPEFEEALNALADGTISWQPWLSGKVGLDGIADAFEMLKDPESHAKIIIEPWRDGAVEALDSNA